MKTKSNKQLVKELYPSALCVDRPTGKQYKIIIADNSIIGQGKTNNDAWTSAYRNVYDHR